MGSNAEDHFILRSRRPFLYLNPISCEAYLSSLKSVVDGVIDGRDCESEKTPLSENVQEFLPHSP
jgi:hypothetical protein